MGSAYKILPHYTYDDWVRWEGQWELIEGHAIAMSPAPVPVHQRVSAKLITQLTIALQKADCQHCHVYNFIDYLVKDDTILQPDVLIVCGDITKKYLDFPPALVVEILSPSTALKDRHTKYELYQQQGVLYYLIVDADKQLIEVYRLVNGEYGLQPSTTTPEITLNTDCIITPDFQNVFE
jgi:Uma2 family endonuclease